MPFAVSQWPYSPDPRQPDFNIFGWDFGQVPPFSWILSTTGATGFFEIFNVGVLLRNNIAFPGLGVYLPIRVLPNDVTVILNIIGTQAPAVGPPPFTIDIQVDIFSFASPSASGRLKLLFPTAIAVKDPITMVVVAPPPNTWPNPAVLTPAKWNVDTP